MKKSSFWAGIRKNASKWIGCRLKTRDWGKKRNRPLFQFLHHYHRPRRISFALFCCQKNGERSGRRFFISLSLSSVRYQICISKGFSHNLCMHFKQCHSHHYHHSYRHHVLFSLNIGHVMSCSPKSEKIVCIHLLSTELTRKKNNEFGSGLLVVAVPGKPGQKQCFPSILLFGF